MSATARLPSSSADLKLVAQNDVQRVCQLVGIDADVAPADTLCQVEQVVRLPLGRIGGCAEQRALDDGGGEVEERSSAADLHLHQERLAFVHRHAAGLAHRLSAPRLRQALLIERVAGLVEHGEHGLQEVRLVVSGGDAGVVRLAAAERMVADAEQPAIEVEADLGHQRFSERLLAFDAECVRDRQRLVLPTEGAVDEPRQHVVQLREQGIDLGLRQAGLVAVEQGIVGIAAQCVAEGLGLLPRQREHGFERTDHGCPIVRRTRWTPSLLAGGRGCGQRDDEITGQGPRLLPVAPD